MRRLAGTVGAAVTLAALLASCTSATTTGHGNPQTPTIVTGSGTLGTPDAHCAQLAAAATKISAAQTALYTGDQHAVSDIDAALQVVRAGAPGGVQTAVDSLSAGFRSASALLANPTSANRQKVAQLAPQLARDGMTVSHYATSTCGH